MLLSSRVRAVKLEGERPAAGVQERGDVQCVRVFRQGPVVADGLHVVDCDLLAGLHAASDLRREGASAFPVRADLGRVLMEQHLPAMQLSMASRWNSPDGGLPRISGTVLKGRRQGGVRGRAEQR